MVASRAHVRSSAKVTVRRVKRLRGGTEWCRASHAAAQNMTCLRCNGGGSATCAITGTPTR